MLPGDPKEQREAEADDETRPRRVEFGHDLGNFVEICGRSDFRSFQQLSIHIFPLQKSAKKKVEVTFVWYLIQ